jgi:hypothetical protein
MTNQETPVYLGDPPTGLAFTISDLLLMQGWAHLHNFIMTIELDYRTNEADCEEVAAFRTGVDAPCLLLIWRNAEAVFVQPLAGRGLHYKSVSHVLESLVSIQQA